MNLGDIRVGQIVYLHFTTRKFSTGVPVTSDSLAVSVYKNDSTTQSTSGITTTFTTGFDGVAGLVSVKIDTSADGTFYAAANDFSVVVTGGTADSVSIVGEVVGYFSIENRSALMPTTAARKLDVSAGGEAGIDWANIGGPTTAQNLSSTNIDVDQVVASVSGAVGSVTGAVGSVTGAVGSVTGNVGGNVTGSVGSLAAQAKADVNAEVLDVLNVDTFAQPGQGTPAATNTIRAMLAYLFKAWRNRTTQTASEYALYNDDAATVDHKAAFSDDGTTADRQEITTGP